MVDGYDVKTNFDGQVFVVLHADCQISKDEILNVLREAGIDVNKVVFLSPEEALLRTDLDGTPVVIPLDAEVCDQFELQTVALRCSNAGGNIIAVFGPGFPYDELHPIADKYGTQCGWSPSDLASCIIGSETDTSFDAAGKEVQRSQAKQVKC